MSDGMGREFTYLSSHATNRYFIPNWGNPLEFEGCQSSIDVFFQAAINTYTFLVFVVDFLNNRNNKTYLKAEIDDYWYSGVVSRFHSTS